MFHGLGGDDRYDNAPLGTTYAFETKKGRSFGDHMLHNVANATLAYGEKGIFRTAQKDLTSLQILEEGKPLTGLQMRVAQEKADIFMAAGLKNVFNKAASYETHISADAVRPDFKTLEMKAPEKKQNASDPVLQNSEDQRTKNGSTITTTVGGTKF
jgi:hypothetical protein